MSTLYIVATPIGNLEDITLRAIRILKEVDLVLCEDTRTTRILFSKYQITTPVLSYNSHSTQSKEEKIIKLLEEGKNLAIVSDAGTPGISDPGTMLVSSVKEKFKGDVKICPIPGASAVTALFSSAGITGGAFTFYGFLPHKKGRETLFRIISNSSIPVIFYESPHRIMKTLESLNKFCPDKNVVIGRELTKIYEEIVDGKPRELLKFFEGNPDKVRGEFVVAVY